MYNHCNRQSNRPITDSSKENSAFFQQTSCLQRVAGISKGMSMVPLFFVLLAFLSFPAAQTLPVETSVLSSTNIELLPDQERRASSKIRELLEKLKENAGKAKDKVDGTGTPEERSFRRVILGLEDDLDAIDADIDKLLDPNQYPSLSPYDAGFMEPVGVPNSLEDHASVVLTLAIEALAAYNALSQPLRDETVGSKIKTIQALMPGYRDDAGL
ncbi:MAG: hypothetical protein O7G85_06055 [Planctomycetota bacterium]|nr:hypothetical protein [Planctomycetota bacterium]